MIKKAKNINNRKGVVRRKKAMSFGKAFQEGGLIRCVSFTRLILTIVIIAFLIFQPFQMVVLATAIDIGSPAINKDSSAWLAQTQVDKTNPANASGKITSIEIWANTNLPNAEVATFYVVSGNNLSTRDNQTIGAVTAGSKQTFAVDLDVVTGDYIGIYGAGGDIEYTTYLGAGQWYLYGDQIPCTNTTFSVTTGTVSMSLYGTGATEEAGGATTSISIGVSATVNEWITLGVSTSSVGLTPNLVSSAGVTSIASSTDINITVGTNNAGGWHLDLLSAGGRLATSTYYIYTCNVTSSIAAGTDMYGVNATTSYAGVDIKDYYDYWGQNIVGTASSTAQELADKSSPNASTTVATMKIMAACDAAQEPGNYSDTLTITATGGA